MCEEEIWKKIPGYEDIYEASNFGRIRTIKNKTTTSVLHGTRHWKQRILKQKTDKGGYKRVTLWKNKIAKDFLVHRLVAISFLEKIKGKEFINHIDGHPSNNNLPNLEWCDSRENLIHAYENRLNQSPDPIVLFNVLTKETHYFYSKSEASRFFGKSHSFIYKLLKEGKDKVGNFEIYIRPK